nr:hypothetical protein [Streptococcus dysgalactiae]
MKTLSDTPKTFYFTATLPNFDQAQKAGSALIGYMIGTYEQSAIDIIYTGNGDIEVEYTSDEDLTENFERITESLNHTDDFEDYDEDDFDFEETEEEIQAEYEAACLADDTQNIINWINESNTLENASQCLDAIVKMLENGTLILKGGSNKD